MMLSKNIQLLQDHILRLNERVQAVSRYPLIKRARYFSCKIDSRLINSLSDPFREINRYLQFFSIQRSDCVVLIGGGLGYMLSEVSKLTESTIIVVEPDESLFFTSLEVLDYTLLPIDRIHFFIGHDIDQLMPFLKENWSLFFEKTLHTIFFPVQTERLESASQLVKGIVSQFEQWLTLAIRHEMLFGERLTQNTIRNIPGICASQGVAYLKDCFVDTPVAIVGAGASLDETISYLRLFSEKYPIIAVDTALHTLAQNHIKPDFIVSTDFSPHNLTHFQELPPSFFQIPLIYEPTIYEGILPLFSGPRFVIQTPDPLFAWIQNRIQLPDYSLPLVGMVSHTAFLLGQLTGSPNLILFGYDFGYFRQQSHTKYATNCIAIEDAQWERLIRVQSVSGSEIRTSPVLMNAKNVFEELLIHFQATNGRVINCSKGVKIQGAPYQDPDSLLSVLPAGLKSLPHIIGVPDDLVMQRYATVRNAWGQLQIEIQTVCELAVAGLAHPSQQAQYFNKIISYTDVIVVLKRILFKAFHTPSDDPIKQRLEAVIDAIDRVLKIN